MKTVCVCVCVRGSVCAFVWQRGGAVITLNGMILSTFRSMLILYPPVIGGTAETL